MENVLIKFNGKNSEFTKQINKKHALQYVEKNWNHSPFSNYDVQTD